MGWELSCYPRSRVNSPGARHPRGVSSGKPNRCARKHRCDLSLMGCNGQQRLPNFLPAFGVFSLGVVELNMGSLWLLSDL